MFCYVSFVLYGWTNSETLDHSDRSTQYYKTVRNTIDRSESTLQQGRAEFQQEVQLREPVLDWSTNDRPVRWIVSLHYW